VLLLQVAYAHTHTHIGACTYATMSGLKESADGPYTWIILNDFLRIVQAVELPV